VDKCVEYLELISAYADGELSEFDSKRVEEHLSTCENCSALLDLYSEISVAVIESNEPIPNALLENVMEKVLNDNVVKMSDVSKKRSMTRIVLSRYVPIAACLALVLLTLPRVFDLNRPSSDSASEVGLRMMTDMGGVRSPSAGGGGGTGASGGASAPIAAPDSLPEAFNSATDDINENATRGEPGGGSGTGESTAPAPTPAPSPSSVPAPQEPDSPAPHEQLSPEAPPAQQQPPAEAPDQTGGSIPLDDPEPADDIHLDEVPLYDIGELESLVPPGNIFSLTDMINDAYIWIEITGELPVFLSQFEPEQPDEMINWEMLFIIPREAALELIEEISGLDGVLIEHSAYNTDSDYAVVFYSSG